MATQLAHPIMKQVKQNKGSTQQAPRTYVVNPPEEPQQQQEEVMAQQEETPQETVEPAKKNMLEELIFCGRLEQTVDIAGNKFVLKTLNNKEHTHVMRELYKVSDGSDLFALRFIILSQALVSINGIPIDNFPTQNEYTEEDINKIRMETINNMQVSVIEKLFEVYNSLVEQSKKIVEGPELKKF